MSERVWVNGVEQPFHEGTLGQWLERLGYDADATGVAVAVNEEVIFRGDWARRAIVAGDRLEIVGAVQGG